MLSRTRLASSGARMLLHIDIAFGRSDTQRKTHSSREVYRVPRFRDRFQEEWLKLNVEADAFLLLKALM